jgi:hypothetical protein
MVIKFIMILNIPPFYINGGPGLATAAYFRKGTRPLGFIMKSTLALLALSLAMPAAAYCQDTTVSKPATKTLQEATVTGHTPPIQHKKDRTDKPTYLNGEDLNNLLSSMNAAQVSRIELMPNPSARYDASGNAGIINIKTKKNDNAGFNATATAAYAQGVYPKSNNTCPSTGAATT